MSRKFDLITLITLLILVASYCYVLMGYHFLLNDEQIYLREAWLFVHNGEWPRIYPLTPLLLSPVLMLAPSLWESLAKLLMLTVSVVGFILAFGGDIVSVAFALSTPIWIFLAGRVMTENMLALTLGLTLVIYKSLLQRGRAGFSSLLLALSLFVMYLCKYSTLVISITLIATLLARMGLRKEILALMFIFMAMVLAYNVFACFSSERWSISFLNIDNIVKSVYTGQAVRLAPSIIVKLLAGVFLAFTPWLLTLLPFHFIHFKRVKDLVEPSLLPAFVAYFVGAIGYYVALSLSTGHAWSVDHVARYLAPLTLMLRKPKTLSKMSILLAVTMSSFLGVMLVYYASHHAHNIAYWSDVKDMLTRLTVT